MTGLFSLLPALLPSFPCRRRAPGARTRAPEMTMTISPPCLALHFPLARSLAESVAGSLAVGSGDGDRLGVQERSSFEK